MGNLWQDLRYGFRRLLQTPGFTLVAVLSLALGIGANTAIFSLVDTVLLRPLPVRAPDQLVTIYGTLHKGADYTIQSHLNFKDYRDRSGDVLAGVLGYRFAAMSLSHGGANERVWGYLVSGNYFDVLGVRPALGRGFLPEEDQTPGSHPVAVLSYGCWQSRFGGDPSIVGRAASINNQQFTVVGVAPKGFIGTEIAYSPEIFVPFMMAKQIEPGNSWLESRTDDNLFVVGRLKDGVTKAQAEAALAALTNQLAREHPQENEGRGVRLLPPGLFIPEIRDSVITFSAVLMGVVGLVLLLACVNLANLLLARATERRKEMAIRLALGASRPRIVRQLLTESIVLSLAGGAFGLLIATWVNALVSAIKLPTDIALVFDLRIDWRVLAFTLGVSLATGVVFSLLPALRSSNPDVVPALKDDTSLGGFRRSRLRNALVVAQVALSLVLLVSAGLIVRGLQAAQAMHPGFNPQNAVALSFDLGLQGYDEQRGRAFQREIVERAKQVPGVRGVTLTDSLPLSINYNSTGIYVEGRPAALNSDLPLATPFYAGLDYFKTLGVPVRGRDFTAQEDKRESRVAVVNETFARKFWHGEDAVGKRFNFGSPSDPYWTVIGVAADGKYNTLGEEPKAVVYRPLLRDYNSNVTLVARVEGDPQAALAALGRAVQSLDPTLPVYSPKTLTEHMSIPLFPARMAAIVLGSFGVLALVLAAIGIYGVMSYVVAGRTREIGLRMALGADRASVLRLIVGQGMTLAVVGLGVGLALAFAAARLLTSQLYGVSPSDPLTFAGVAALLAAVAFLACYLPARRATRVDPMIALRYE
ncbi:MAG TPA: ABC transporter permease [Pyrinomonadaceae bacterium]|nr:ABC transporter permease [Pyrinomonadaceae bacterium]